MSSSHNLSLTVAPILALLLLLPTSHSLGYLKLPRSRNFVAYEDTVWWPRTETDPEPETTPQGLDRGGTLAQCGIVETLRNYDTPKNIFGDDMPINVQMVYEQEGEITIEVSLISSNGGHFQFSMCPIEWNEIPTKECFDAHPLEFVKDNYYGAYEDPNYPERIYVPDGKVTGRVDDETGFPGNKQEFSYQMNLPCGVTGDLVLLQWYFVTAQDCYHEGYLDYSFPPEWGDTFEEKINECPKPLPPDGDGLPLQYWNCAEVEILKTGPTDRCAPTMEPSSSPTTGVTVRPTKEPTVKPTPKPVLVTEDPTDTPTSSPTYGQPLATCDEICLVPIDAVECRNYDNLESIPACLDSSGKTVNVGDICEGSGECTTSEELDNCSPDFDVYKRVASCARDDEGETPEDTPISIPVLENDVDGVGDGLTIVDVTEPEFGSVEIVDDEIVYTPDPGYNGPDDFEYSVLDGNGFISSADVAVDVLPVNDPPVANDDEATTPTNTNINIPVLDNDSDSDGSLTIESVTQPENGVAGIRPDGTVIYKPNPDYVGTDSFTYQICDSEDQCDEATVTVTVEPPPNESPVAKDDFVTISEGMSSWPQIPVLANDNDPDGDPLIVTEVTDPENGSVSISEDEEGVVYEPDEGFTGVDTFEYKTCDPSGECDTATVTITVDPSNNDPIVFDDREDTPEGEPILIDVLENDIPDTGLVITDVTEPANGMCEATADGFILYTPDDGFFGQDECTYTACVEGTTDCDEGTIIVDVVEKPKLPPLAVDDPVTTNEDEPVTLDPLENDQSPIGSPLTLDSVDDGENGTCEINADATVTYTPVAGFHGIDICLYTVCDENNLCDEGAIVVDVADGNVPPIAQDDEVTTPYNTPVTVPVLDNDEDPNGDELTITDVTQGLHGKCSITEDNQIVYEPDPGYSGPDICPYVVCDTSNECDTANVFIEVLPGPPTAEDDTTQTPPDTPVLTDVLDNDTHPQNLPLEVTDIASQPENGVCVVADGQVEFIPDEGFMGTDRCDYVVCVEGTDECDVGTLTVDVLPPAPVAEDDAAQTPPDTPVTVPVLDNDTHPQNLPLEVTAIGKQPENGDCLVVDGQVQFTPDEGFMGTDSCDYVVCVEGTDECDEGTVTVDVVPPAPVAEDDTAQTPPDTPVTVPVLDNDTHPQNLPLEVTDIAQPPENGVCEIVNGQVQFTPNEGFTGTDSCDYTVCVEGTNVCDEGTVTVDVVSVIPAPVAEDDTAHTPPDTPVTVPVLDNDTHPQNLPLEVTAIGKQPENGDCLVVDGQVQFTPDEGFIGTDNCDYVVCVEGTTECDEGTVTVGVLQPPVAEDDTADTEPGIPVLTDVVENDSHPQGLPLVITDVARPPENGVCEVIVGQVQYTPYQNFTGTDSCDYVVCVEETRVCDTGELVVNVVQPPPRANDDKERTPVNTPVVSYVVENDLNPSSDKPLVIVNATQPENGSCDFSSDGYVQYEPSQDFIGTASCDYTVCIEGTSACDTATFVVDVVEVKIAKDDEIETPQDTPITVDVLENDSHPEDPEKPLVVTNVSQPENGSCEVIDNQIEFIPDQGFSGLDECVYTVCAEVNTNVEEETVEVCDEGTLVVEVVPEPVANDDEAETPPNTPVSVDVMSNDEPQDLLVITEVTQPENGICKVVGNQIKYTPNADFGQVDTCLYTVCIESNPASCDEGKVTVTILTESPTDGPIQPPLALPSMQPTFKPTMGNVRPYSIDDYASTPVNLPVIIDVLVNDFDMDGDELTVISVTEPSNGQNEINPDGTVLYFPSPDFSGEDSFKYTISDGNGNTAEATVTVSVVESVGPADSEPTNKPTDEPTVQQTKKPSNRPSVEPSARPTMKSSLRPSMKPSARPAMKPSLQAITCADMCFEPLEPDQCPSCDPSILPSCSDPSLGLNALCESDGQCGLSDRLNNCKGTFDVYRRVSCSGEPTTPGVCVIREGETVTISADADAYVSADENSKGFNNEAILIDEFPKTDGLIKWKLTEEICECVSIKRVMLRLYVIDSSRGGGFVHVMNPTWEESSVTWSNSNKSSGPPLVQIGQAINEKWVEADVTGLVSNSDEHVAVRIQSCLKNRVQYASKEYQQGQYAPQLVIEFGPPPIGMHLLASHHNMQPHYGRKLGGSSSRSSSTKKSSNTKKSSSTSAKSSKPSSTKKSTKSSKHSKGSTKDSSSNDGGGGDPIIPDIPVCPDPNLDIDLSTAVSAYAKGDSTIIYSEEDKSFGSDVLLELSPPQCGDMHTMINFDVKSLVDSPTVEYASILIHVVEGSDLSGATFLHAPVPSDWLENSVTWRNAPEYDTVIGSLSTIKNGMWYEVDVTSAIQNLSSDYLSIRVIPSAVTDASCDHIKLIFASKELDGFGPQLVVVPNIGRASSEPPLQSSQYEETLAQEWQQSKISPGPPMQSSQQVDLPSFDLIFSSSASGIFSEVRSDFDDCSAGNAPPAGELFIIPTADSYVSPRGKRLNHGKEPLLVVDSRPGNIALMKFDLTCLKSRSITSAVLKVYSIDGSVNGGMFHVMISNDESAWVEELVTWNNAPMSYNNYGQLKKVRSETWNELDITSALMGNVGNFVTITIDSTSAKRVVYSSKEGGHPPQLTIGHEEHIIQPRLEPISCLIPASSAPLTFTPIEDAVIKEASRDTNFSYMSNLNSRNEPGSRVDSLMKFVFYCSYSESIVSRAVLRLFCENGAPRGGKIVSVLGSWAEDKVTWNSAPVTLADFSKEIGRVRKGYWVEIDVTSAITAVEGYEMTFRIEGAHVNAASYGSKDDGAYAPKLDIFF